MTERFLYYGGRNDDCQEFNTRPTSSLNNAGQRCPALLVSGKKTKPGFTSKCIWLQLAQSAHGKVPILEPEAYYSHQMGFACMSYLKVLVSWPDRGNGAVHNDNSDRIFEAHQVVIHYISSLPILLRAVLTA
jgi:hypothetical protein